MKGPNTPLVQGFCLLSFQPSLPTSRSKGNGQRKAVACGHESCFPKTNEGGSDIIPRQKLEVRTIISEVLSCQLIEHLFLRCEKQAMILQGKDRKDRSMKIASATPTTHFNWLLLSCDITEILKLSSKYISPKVYSDMLAPLWLFF